MAVGCIAGRQARFDQGFEGSVGGQPIWGDSLHQVVRLLGALHTQSSTDVCYPTLEWGGGALSPLGTAK